MNAICRRLYKPFAAKVIPSVMVSVLLYNRHAQQRISSPSMPDDEDAVHPLCFRQKLIEDCFYFLLDMSPFFLCVIFSTNRDAYNARTCPR